MSNYWPAMSVGAEAGAGAKLIKVGEPDKFRYLWAYDVESKRVGMWRVSDGDEKVIGSDRQMSSEVLELQRRGQLNRVTGAEMAGIERHMGKSQVDTIQSLKASIASNKTDLDRRLDEKLKERVRDLVLPKYTELVSAISSGVVPLGFKPFGDAKAGTAAWRRQAASHVLGKLWSSEMSERVVEVWLRREKFPVDGLGNQDLQFALSLMFDDVAGEWLPRREG